MRLQKEFIFIGSTDLDPISVISVKAIKNNVGHKQQRVYRKCFVLFCVYQVDTVHGEARINHLALSVPVSANRTVIVKLQSRSIPCNQALSNFNTGQDSGPLFELTFGGLSLEL